jgi:hypothetical protein
VVQAPHDWTVRLAPEVRDEDSFETSYISASSIVVHLRIVTIS